MRKDAAFQIIAKRLAHVGARCVVVALAVELACTCEFEPGLEVLGNRFVEQRALRVVRVVEFRLGR